LFFVADGKLMAVDVSTSGTTFHTGIPKMMFDSQVGGRYFWVNYAVAPDGQRFLFAMPAEHQTAPPMTVILNWAAGLKK
jgi:hypothetical protein